MSTDVVSDAIYISLLYYHSIYLERKEMSADVVCMALGTVPSGEQRCRFLGVGLADNTVRIISLDPTDCLTPLSMQVEFIHY